MDLDRWPLPVVSSTSTISPAPILRDSPSLVVSSTPASRLMMYCRRGAGCQGRSCSAWVCRKMMPLANWRAEVLPSGPSFTHSMVISRQCDSPAASQYRLCTRMPILLIPPVWLALFRERLWSFDIVLAVDVFLLRRIHFAHRSLQVLLIQAAIRRLLRCPHGLGRALQNQAGPTFRGLQSLAFRHDLGHEAEFEPLPRRNAPAGQDHSQRLLDRDRPRQPMHATAARDQSNAWFGQREDRVLGCDDDVAGERGFESAAHRHAIHRRDQRLVEIETMRQSGEPVWSVRPALARRLDLEVVAGGERSAAGAGDDTDPQVVAFGELIPHRGQFVVGVG